MKTSKKGYKKNSPDRKNPFNIIPSGNISMKDVKHPVMGVDNFGYMQMMMPGGEYKFPGSHVLEFPIKQQGGSTSDTLTFTSPIVGDSTIYKSGNVPRAIDKTQSWDPMDKALKEWNQWVRKNPPGSYNNPGEGISVTEWMYMMGYPDPFTKQCVGPNCSEKKLGGSLVKHQEGGDVMFDEEVVPDSTRHKELIQLEKQRAAFQQQQQMFDPYVKQFGQPTPVSLDQMFRTGANFSRSALPEGAETSYKFKAPKGVDIPLVPTTKATTVFSDPQMGQEFYVTGVSDVNVPAYDLFDPYADIDMTIEPEPLYTEPKKPKTFKVPQETIKQKPGAWYRDESGNLVQASIMTTVGESGVPDFKKGGNWIQDVTKSVEKRGTKGVCTGDKFGSSSCPSGSKRYNLAKTFREMAKSRKKEFGGPIVPQGMGTDDIIAKNRNMFTSYLSNNMLGHLANQEADELGMMMQMGGNFGYDPGMYNQQAFGAASMNTMGQEFGNFMDLSRQGFTNPYYEMMMKKCGGVHKMQGGGSKTEVPDWAKGENLQANKERLMGLYSGEGITDEFGNVYTESDLYNQKSENIPAKTIYPMGNYTEPVGTTESMQPGYTSNLSFIPGHQVQQGYNMFPMNFNPYYKMKGQGMNFSGVPGVTFDPSQVYLKDYDYRGRLFGQGPRKVSMTFSPLTGGMTSGTGTGIGASNITPSQNKDAFIERHIDPTLYSKMVEGDASPEEIAEYNRQHQKYSTQYDDRTQQVGTPTGLPVKKNLGTRFQNFLQEQQAKRERKRRMKTPPFETSVHPSLRKQDGGDVTLEWKRKMGINPEEAVNWGLAGVNALSSFGEAQDAYKNKQIMQQRMNADALFQPMQAGDASRGTYDPNTGAFRPHQMTPVQFSGMNFGQVGSPVSFKEGGEYNLSESEIKKILAMGGSIEYID